MYISANIAQEGSGFPVLHPALFQYICTGQYTDLPIEDEDVPDTDVKSLLHLVRVLAMLFIAMLALCL